MARTARTLIHPPAALADQFPNGRDVYLPELTHFIPMQDPNLVARFIVDAHAQLSPAET